MREILFCGKRVDNGEWVYGLPYKAKYGCISSIVNDDEERFLIFSETVRQYTGLTDSNGKRIFEGDIIRYADLYEYNCYLESLDNPEAYDGTDFGNIWTIDEVVYCIKIGYPAFDLNKHDWEINGLSNLNENSQYFYEVIGNIHDNPELLENKK